MKKEYQVTDFLHGLVQIDEGMPTRLYRMTEDEILQAKERGRELYKESAGNEIRFCIDEGKATITLEFGDEGGEVELYYGDFYDKKLCYEKGVHEITVELPDVLRRHSEWYEKKGFCPEVVRFMLRSNDLKLVALPDNISPVPKEFLPEMKCVCYGTSITHGLGLTSYSASYPRVMTKIMRCDMINLGVSGNAFCEEVVAHRINRMEFDFVTVCISVNMLCQKVTGEEFKTASRNFIDIIHKQHPNKKIFCISVLPFFVDHKCLPNPPDMVSTPDEFREVLTQVVADFNSENIILINGQDVLTSVEGLNLDFLHPNDYGNYEMGHYLAKFIKERL